jgi:hypothetical protein
VAVDLLKELLAAGFVKPPEANVAPATRGPGQRG